MDMKIIHAVEWRCSSAGIVLNRAVTPPILYYPISLQKVVLMEENRKEGLIDAMVHPPGDVVAAAEVADEVVVMTLDKVIKSMTTPSLYHHVRMEAARI